MPTPDSAALVPARVVLVPGECVVVEINSARLQIKCAPPLAVQPGDWILTDGESLIRRIDPAEAKSLLRNLSELVEITTNAL